MPTGKRLNPCNKRAMQIKIQSMIAIAIMGIKELAGAQGTKPWLRPPGGRFGFHAADAGKLGGAEGLARRT